MSQTSTSKSLAAGRPPVPFLGAFAIGLAKLIGAIVGVFSAVQLLYAFGWVLLYLLSRVDMTADIPETAWVLALDASWACFVAVIGFFICLAVVALAAGLVASIGGWSWPTPLRELLGEETKQS